MPYKKKENLTRKRALQSLFDLDYRLFKINLEKKKPQTCNWQKGACLKSRGHINGLDAYGFLPHWHGFTVLDIDYHPAFESKDGFRNQGRDECRKLLKDFIAELERNIPDFRSKLVFWCFSGSGYGAHLYFKSPPSYYDESKHQDYMKRKKHQLGWCDIFDGGGYVVIHEPEKFRKAIKNYGFCDDIEEDDLKWIMETWPRIVPSSGKKSRPIVNSAVKKPVPVQNDIDIVSVIRSIAGTENMNVPLSDKTDKKGNIVFPWSPIQIAWLMEKICPAKFADYDFWLKLGMALHDAGTSPLLFRIWSSLIISLSPCAKSWHAKLEKKWLSFTRGGGISMGTICYEAGFKCNGGKDFSDIDNYITQYIAFTNSRKFLSRSAIHQHYSASGISNAPHTDRSFRRHFFTKIDVRSKNRGGNGGGICIIAPLYEEAVLKGVRGYRGLRIRNEWEAGAIRMAINLGKEMDL